MQLCRRPVPLQCCQLRRLRQSVATAAATSQFRQSAGRIDALVEHISRRSSRRHQKQPVAQFLRGATAGIQRLIRTASGRCFTTQFRQSASTVAPIIRRIAISPAGPSGLPTRRRIRQSGFRLRRLLPRAVEGGLRCWSGPSAAHGRRPIRHFAPTSAAPAFGFGLSASHAHLASAHHADQLVSHPGVQCSSNFGTLPEPPSVSICNIFSHFV